MGASFASASIIIAVYGHVDLAVRFLFAAYAFDILDGVIARKSSGSSREGLMLDRAIDRLSQVVAPLIIYASWLAGLEDRPGLLDVVLIAVYSSIIIPVSLYRLVYRIVWSLEYFHGLPLFVHAGLLLTSIVSSTPINPGILVIAALMSALPVKYFRTSRRETPSPMPLPRLLTVALLALLPYDNTLVKYAALSVKWGLIVYIALGPVLYHIIAHYSKQQKTKEDPKKNK